MDKFLKTIIASFVFLIIIISIFLTLLLNNKINNDYESYIKNTTYLGYLFFFFLGFFSTNQYQKKGLIVSFIYGFVLVLILFLISYIGFESFNISKLIFYLICVLSCIFGGLIGINIKKLF